MLIGIRRFDFSLAFALNRSVHQSHGMFHRQQAHCWRSSSNFCQSATVCSRLEMSTVVLLLSGLCSGRSVSQSGSCLLWHSNPTLTSTHSRWLLTSRTAIDWRSPTTGPVICECLLSCLLESSLSRVILICLICLLYQSTNQIMDSYSSSMMCLVC